MTKHKSRQEMSRMTRSTDGEVAMLKAVIASLEDKVREGEKDRIINKRLYQKRVLLASSPGDRKLKDGVDALSELKKRWDEEIAIKNRRCAEQAAKIEELRTVMLRIKSNKFVKDMLEKDKHRNKDKEDLADDLDKAIEISDDVFRHQNVE